MREIYSPIDFNESLIFKKMPQILNVLLVDRTKSTPKRRKNIIWANSNYINFGSKAYSPTAEIKPELISGHMSNTIKPRALKSLELQRKRTQLNAEVFTPIWIIKNQNDEIELNFRNDDLTTYVKRKWLEITCGEGPYMVSRYDMETGGFIPLSDRQGFIDRKLMRINEEVNSYSEWLYLTKEAFKASYGYEWNGDSLLLARENLLSSYWDYYYSKWEKEPEYENLLEIAEIISYNIFQMDGLKYIIPLSEEKKRNEKRQMLLFDFEDEIEEYYIIRPGTKVKIMNWEKQKMEYFDKGEK